MRKLRLARRIIRNSRRVKSISTWQQHLILVEEILRVPKSLKGAVVECCCFNGASTISLSLACALTERTLFVCDSFQGLPPPEPGEQYDVSLAELGNYYSWQQGEFSSDEGLAGVQRNVEMFGDIGVCRFIKGRLLQTALMGSWVSGRPPASHSMKKTQSQSADVEAPHIAEGAFLLLLTART